MGRKKNGRRRQADKPKPKRAGKKEREARARKAGGSGAADLTTGQRRLLHEPEGTDDEEVLVVTDDEEGRPAFAWREEVEKQAKQTKQAEQANTSAAKVRTEWWAVCTACGKRGGGAQALLRCARCRWARYCERACQKRHWKQGGHKASVIRIPARADPPWVR